jgi:hypothetical protein
MVDQKTLRSFTWRPGVLTVLVYILVVFVCEIIVVNTSLKVTGLAARTLDILDRPIYFFLSSHEIQEWFIPSGGSADFLSWKSAVVLITTVMRLVFGGPFYFVVGLIAGFLYKRRPLRRRLRLDDN